MSINPQRVKKVIIDGNEYPLKPGPSDWPKNVVMQGRKQRLTIYLPAVTPARSP